MRWAIPIVIWDMSETPGSRIPHLIFGLIAFGAAAQCAFDYPQLPERMASHFGASGAANGWMTKPAFFAVYAAMVVLAAVVGYFAPRFIQKKSPDKINLPNKEYWLAPERRAQTFAYFETFFAWFGCAFLLLEVFAMGLAMRANFAAPPRLPTGPIISAIVAFVFFNIGAVFMMLRRFSKTGQEQLN